MIRNSVGGVLFLMFPSLENTHHGVFFASSFCSMLVASPAFLHSFHAGATPYPVIPLSFPLCWFVPLFLAPLSFSFLVYSLVLERQWLSENGHMSKHAVSISENSL